MSRTWIVKLLAAAATAVAAFAGSPAWAQGWGWDAPRPRPPWWDQRPRYADPYDYEAPRYRRYRTPDARRYGRGYYDDYDAQEYEAPRPRYGNRGENRDTAGGDEQDADGKITRSGGPRPAIGALAPPIVPFSAAYAPGSIVIDTSARKLYYVRNGRSAFAYPIGVGRDGFSWTGAEKVSRVADWPDWYPPAEMRERKPELPEKMTGGINNPLGAKAIYLGNTLYRIHGTNEPKSIGRAESSGCFRMMNQHVMHLASLVQVGTEVNIVRSLGRAPVTASVEPRTAPQPRPAQRPRPRMEWSSDPNPEPYFADDGYLR